MQSNLAGRLSLMWSCLVDLRKIKVSRDDYGKQALKQNKERNRRDKPIDIVHGVEKHSHALPWVD